MNCEATPDDIGDARVVLQRIVILGGAGHGSDVLTLLFRLNLLGCVDGVVDDAPLLPRMHKWGVRHLGGFDGFLLEERLWVLGVGTPAVRSHVRTRLHLPVDQARSFVDAEATIGFGVSTGVGLTVFAGARVSSLCVLGDFVHLSQNTIVGHDSVLGAGTCIMPGAAISGDVTIGKDVFVGTNASILQGLTLGDGAIVGAGAVVTRNVKSHSTVKGVPAR